MRPLILLFLSSIALYAQGTNPLLLSTSDVSGTCPARHMDLSISSGNIFYCNANTNQWAPLWTNTNVVPVANGGCGTSLAALGPGVLYQASAGSNCSSGPVVTATPTANDIPQATSGGVLAAGWTGWLTNGITTSTTQAVSGAANLSSTSDLCVHTKYTIAYNNAGLNIASSTPLLSLFIATNTKVRLCSLEINPTTAFAGTSLTAATVQVQSSGVPIIYYSPAQDLEQAVVSGTYTSGITVTCTTGQTCLISNLGSGNANATVACTGSNAIAGSTALVFTANGSGYMTAPTTGTVSAGTATSCSGTPVIATTLGEANDYWSDILNVIDLQGLTVNAQFTLTGAQGNALTAGSVDIVIGTYTRP